MVHETNRIGLVDVSMLHKFSIMVYQGVGGGH